MIKIVKFVISILMVVNLCTVAIAENFFIEAKNKFDEEKIKDSKFLFQRNIIFNPKDAKSYLYLAKIFNSEENQKEEIKNLETTLLLEPDNEEAMLMLINVELKKSDYLKVKKLTENFTVICKKLCEQKKNIEENLKNIEPKDES